LGEMMNLVALAPRQEPDTLETPFGGEVLIVI
jgi:hypothetical protein